MEAKYPWWVKISIWSSHKRRTVKIWAILSIVLFIINFVDIIYAYHTDKELNLKSIKWSAAFLLIFLLYFLSIRWMNKHGDWSKIRENWADWKDLLKGAFVMGLLIFLILPEAISGFVDGHRG